jgi:Serine incorporator (Serinc)
VTDHARARLDSRLIRVVMQMIFALNSMLAWLMKTDFMIRQIEKWSYDYIKMDCEGDKCYGVLAVCTTVLSGPAFVLIVLNPRSTASALPLRSYTPY